MEILHVIPSVGPARGGPSFVVSALARGLTEAGAAVTVVTSDDNGDRRLDVKCGESVRDLGVVYRYFRRQTKFYIVSVGLSRWLRENVAEFDVVHVHAVFSFASVAAAYWARKRGVPYVVHPMGALNDWGVRNRRPALKRLSLWLIERRLLENAAAVHYTSEQEQLEAEQLGVRGRGVIIPEPAGVPGSMPGGGFRKRYPQHASRLWLLFLSRVDTKKGLDLLLPAFAKLRESEPDTALVVAGDGNARLMTGLKREADKLGIAEDVIWTGFVAGAAKDALFADADVFVLPSYSENFAVAVVEAMAAGLPVVVTDGVAIHREIAEADAGLVTKCDAAEICEALLALATNAELRARLGRNGAQLAQERYSTKSVTRQLMQLYADILCGLFPAATRVAGGCSR